VVVAEPVCLTEVVITALSNEAFDITRSAHLSFENWLFDRSILRQGSTHAFSPELPQQNGKDSVQYRHSYYFRVDMAQPVQQGFAQRGKTRFVVTSTEDLVGNESKSGTPREEDSESDPDGVEINEGFLASSLLDSVSPPAGAERPPLLPSTNHISVDSDPPASDVAFCSHSLSRLIDAQDDCTLYVRTVDLAHIGVLNGDWVRTRVVDSPNVDLTS
jgi:peroxin-6